MLSLGYEQWIHHNRRLWLCLMTELIVIVVSQSRQLPGAMSSAFRMKMAGTNNNSDIDRSIQAYHNMNKFLAAFLEHVSKFNSVCTELGVWPFLNITNLLRHELK